jgi:aerobic carbon-monoxide dehydrogenase medium subunit
VPSSAESSRPGALASVVSAESVDEAVQILSEVEDSAPLAGGTWIMRRERRGEPTKPLYVSLRQIRELREVELGARTRFGACVTHTALAYGLQDVRQLAGLRDAAGRSANPAVRNMATIGGGLAAARFPASDLVPALLALDAEVESTASGDLSLEAFLGRRDANGRRAELIAGVVVPALPIRSAHVRLPLRSGGDYPVAIVSIADPGDGRLRIAVGSVTAVAFRWDALEAEISSSDAPAAAAAAARELIGTVKPRDGIDAPGWYRLEVLPTLVERAIQRLQDEGQA